MIIFLLLMCIEKANEFCMQLDENIYRTSRRKPAVEKQKYYSPILTFADNEI